MKTTNAKQAKFLRSIKARWPFNLFLSSKVPAGFWSGMRLKSFQPQKCETTMPFWFFTRNPFKSMYFASQSMAAELSTAVPIIYAMEGFDARFAYIITSNKAEFHQKATTKTTFTCKVDEKLIEVIQKAVESGEPSSYTAHTLGTNSSGELVSEFWFTWSFKVRS